ncbi:MAG: JmjC domain-containing protein, partial [Stackebrandtia sp.]
QAGGRDLASLPWDVMKARPTPESVVELATVQPPLLSAQDGQVVFTAADQKFSLPEAHRAACETLVRERRISVGDLAERADTPIAATSALVSALLRARLVTVSDPS